MLRVLVTLAVFVAAPVVAAEQSFPVPVFDRLSLAGPPDVTVTTGKAVSVRAIGNQRALDRLEIKVENGALGIGTKRGMNWNGWKNLGAVRIVVTVPMLRGVSVGGSGTVAVDRIKVPAFAADVGGSGGIRVASLDVGRAKFEVGGSGRIEAAGRCRTADASVSGSGAVRIAALKCGTLSVDVAGSGNVAANASRSAAVSLAGSGDVRVSGGARCTVAKQVSGTVNCAA